MRSAGVLLAVASLPSKHGIGDFGDEAKKFIKIIKEGGFKIWQILPLNPVGYGHSPYQPFSSNAMDELYISLEELEKDGLISKVPSKNSTSSKIEYEELRIFKGKYYHLAYEKFISLHLQELEKFIIDEAWVYTFAIFMAFKKRNNLVSWNEWKKEEMDYIIDHKLDLDDYLEDIYYEIFLQYELLKQWKSLHKFASELDIKIVGDMPFYVGFDSVDVWANQNMFLLDEKHNPTVIAGVPPDYFSKTGQRWGNPIYNWKALEENKFDFYISRVSYSAKIYDIVRIDHFRAFDTYWQIPASCPTAVEGEWLFAPGYAFFRKLYARFPKVEIIAEDLGDLRPEVLTLRDHFSLPGMKVVEFTFIDEEVEMHKKENKENMVAYIATHDNQTLLGWYKDLKVDMQLKVKEALSRLKLNSDDITEAFLSYTLSLPAKYAILAVSDILGLTDEARTNKPGIIDEVNWTWKLVDFKELTNRMPNINALIRKANR